MGLVAQGQRLHHRRCEAGRRRRQGLRRGDRRDGQGHRPARLVRCRAHRATRYRGVQPDMEQRHDAEGRDHAGPVGCHQGDRLVVRRRHQERLEPRQLRRGHRSRTVRAHRHAARRRHRRQGHQAGQRRLGQPGPRPPLGIRPPGAVWCGQCLGVDLRRQRLAARRGGSHPGTRPVRSGRCRAVGRGDGGSRPWY